VRASVGTEAPARSGEVEYSVDRTSICIEIMTQVTASQEPARSAGASAKLRHSSRRAPLTGPAQTSYGLVSLRRSRTRPREQRLPHPGWSTLMPAAALDSGSRAAWSPCHLGWGHLDLGKCRTVMRIAALTGGPRTFPAPRPTESPVGKLSTKRPSSSALTGRVWVPASAARGA
jgi:hypothetical protein